MRRFFGSAAQWYLVFSLVLLALPCSAQETKAAEGDARLAATGDANRDRIVRALAQGDAAGAERLFTELSAASTKAPSGIQNGSIAYEELKACGFYPQETRLECILDIKQPGGFGGGAPSRATHEFVSFCVDWNCNGSFSADEAVGLGIVHMHDDFPTLAQPPWQYAVYRDIDPPGSLSQQCHMRTAGGGGGVLTTTKPVTIKARAILQWFAPVVGCNVSPGWGNFVDFRIRLDPVR